MMRKDRLADEGFVRLPCSAPLRYLRDWSAWARLLTRVDPRAAYAFGFEGCLLKPGALVAKRELPEPAVLLECAGPVRRQSGHRRQPSLYVLWRYDRGAGQWVDVARTLAEAWEWAQDLRGPALRALGQGKASARPLERGQLERALERLEEALDAELAALPAAARGPFLAAFGERLLARLAASQPAAEGRARNCRHPGIPQGLPARPRPRQGR
jgi:hypothetical protein